MEERNPNLQREPMISLPIGSFPQIQVVIPAALFVLTLVLLGEAVTGNLLYIAILAGLCVILFFSIRWFRELFPGRSFWHLMWNVQMAQQYLPSRDLHSIPLVINYDVQQAQPSSGH